VDPGTAVKESLVSKNTTDSGEGERRRQGRGKGGDREGERGRHSANSCLSLPLEGIASKDQSKITDGAHGETRLRVQLLV